MRVVYPRLQRWWWHSRGSEPRQPPSLATHSIALEPFSRAHINNSWPRPIPARSSLPLPILFHSSLWSRGDTIVPLQQKSRPPETRSTAEETGGGHASHSLDALPSGNQAPLADGGLSAAGPTLISVKANEEHTRVPDFYLFSFLSSLCDFMLVCNFCFQHCS